MRILITGSDCPLGALLAQRLEPEHDLVLAPASADLRQPGIVAPLVEGVEAIAHLSAFPAATPKTAAEEAEVLLHAGRGTYVLQKAALEAGVSRIVLASRLEVVERYPSEYRVDETWQPRPRPEADALAPYLAELTLREFARAEAIYGICVRFGSPEEGSGSFTPLPAAAEALERALTMELPPSGHRWRLLHFDASGRFPADEAAKAPFSLTPAGA